MHFATFSKFKTYLMNFYQGNTTFKIISLGKFFTYLAITTFLFRFSLWQYRFQRIFLVLALCCAVYYIFTSKQVQHYIITRYKKALIILSVFIFLTFFGTFISFFIFYNLSWTHIIESYIPLIISALIFLLISIFGIEDIKLYQKIYYPFLILLIPFLYLYLPNPIFADSLFDQYGALMGFFENPNLYAGYSIILSIYFFWNFLSTHLVLHKIFNFILFTFTISIIEMTASRGGWIVILISCLFLIICYVRYSKKKLLTFITLILLLVCTAKIAFIISPHYQARYAAGEYNSFKLKTTNLKKSVSENKFDLFLRSVRPVIWQQSIQAIKQNPWGYGPGYNTLLHMSAEGENDFVSHNLLLQAGLTGGISLLALLLVFLVTILSIFFKLILRENFFSHTHFQFTILLATFTYSFFGEYLYDSRIWIVTSSTILLFYIINSTDKKIVYDRHK